MKCHKLRTPEEFRNSILGKSLLEIYQANEDLAISEYNRLTSPEFLEIFGDWIPNDDEKTEIIDISRLDKEGRPAIFPMEHNPSMYYVLDKEKNHLPLEYDGLKNYFDSSEIKNIVKAVIFYIVQQNSTEKNYSSFLSNKFDMSSLINKFIEFKTNELTKLRDSYKENSAEYNKYDLLLDNVVALEFHKKELKYLLSKEFKSMGLQYKITEGEAKLKEIQNENDESDEMDTLEKEGSSREYDVATYEKNTKDFINKELIFLLNFVKTNELEETLNSPTFFSFDEIHKIIQNLVSNKVSTLQEGAVKLTDTYELAKEEISKLINAKYGRHDLSDLINVLDGLDNDKKTQFTKLILTKNNFLTTEIKEDGSYVILNISDVNSKHKSILESWGVDFKDIFIPRVSVKKTKADGTVVERFKSDVLYKKIAEQKGKIDDYLQAVAKLQNGLTLGTLSDIQITKQLDSVIELTKNSLNELGINISKQAFMFTLVGYSMEEKPAVILKSLKAILVSEQYMIDDIINRNIKLLGTNKVYDNPLKTQDVFVRMSKHEALFSNDSSENTVRNGDKQYWTFSNFNYLDFKQQVWKQSRLELERLSQLPHSESSMYVKYFLATEIEDEELRLKTSNRRIQTELMSYVFNSIQKEDDLAHSTDNKEIKLVDALQDYLHKVLQAKIAKRSYIKTSAPADKGTGRELGLPVFFDANLTVLDNGDFTISEQVIDVFENYYKSDLKRAVLAYEDIKFVEASKTKQEYFDRRKKLVSYYHIKKNKQGYWTGRDEDYKLVGNAFKSQIFGTLNIPGLKVLNELNEPIYDLNFDLSNDQSQVLREYIKTHLKNLILRDTNFLKEKGIFNTTRGGKKFLKIDTLLYRKYETRKDPALAITADFTVNTLISHIEYSKMYSGDPAYYKDMKDYNKRIPGTYTDGIILRVGINEEDRFFNVAVIDSIETSSKFREQLTEDLGEDLYNKMDTTDAQGYITPKRWKFIISRSKGWSPRHEEVYRKLTGINVKPLTEKDKGLVAQSLKGVYFNVSEQGVPTYLKYSQFVLSDVTASSSAMKNILDAMKRDDIDELVFSSGVKAGAFASTKITDKEGNILSTDNIKFNSFKLDNRYYKIQQDLPVKGLKQTQISSQFKKNIFDSMAFNLERLYEIGDKTYTTDETIREIHKLISMLSDIGLEEFKQMVGYNNDYVITNKSKFIQMIIEELAANNPQENIIEGLEKGLRPSAFPQAEKKILSKIFSLLKKKVINVKTNGGGFIQTSSFGFDFNAKDTPHGIKWFIDPSTLKPPMYLRDDKGEYVYNTDANGNKRKVVTSGQILLSQSEFYKLFKTKFREGASMTGKQLLKHIDPRVLKNVIGYRIPNQGLSSSSPLEIVGILPEGHGDAVLAYSEITRQTGSDFDIDKMYLMLPNSVWNKDTAQLKYVEYNESIVDSEQKKYAIQNRLLEVYLSVLKHPDNLKAIMSPIDDDFISDNIKILNPEESSVIFQDFSGIQQLLNKFSYAGGKAGVGQNANQLVDNSISQILELTLNKRFLGWGHATNNMETILDREYSVELTDAEKQAYLTLFGLPENTRTEKFLINKSISLILNANVDIAKDNYISRGNWNTITTNVGLLLLRAGAHPYQVNALLAQPIIKQYVEKVVNSEGLTSTENSRAAADKLEKEYIQKIIQNNTRSEDPAEYENWIYQNNQGYLTQYSLVDLLNNIKEPTLDETYLLNQIKLLHIFEDLIESAKPVRNAIMASKSDTEGAFFSITSMLIHRNTVSNMLTNIIKNKIGSVKGIEKKFFRDGFLTFSGSNYINSVIEMERLLKSNLSYFPMANQYIEDLLNEISFQIRNSLLIDERLGEAIYKSVSTYIKSGFPLFKKYNTPETVDELYKNLSDKTKVLQSQNLENFFLDNLEVKMKEGIEFVGLSDSEKSPGFSNSMVNGWRDLLQSSDASLREYAEELVIFSFFQSGFNYNMNEIFSYIPHEWYIKHKFDKYMYEFELPENNEPFIDAFYKHNWDNTLIVPRVTLSSFVLGKPIYLEKKGAFYRSDLKRTGHIIVSDSSYGFETKQHDGSKIVRYKPYLLNVGKVEVDNTNMMLQDSNPVQPKDILYKLVGYLPTGQGVYMPTNKLGNKQHMEYEFGKLRKSSNIEENNLILPTIEKSEEAFATNRESYKIWLEGNHIIPKEEYESLHFEKEEAVDLLDFLNYNAKVDSSNITIEVEKKDEASPFNIKTDKFNPNSLANRLTNPNWYSKGLMDVEAPYKANASKIKAPHLSPEEALKYDMNLMYSLQIKKFRKNPELIDEINEAGGLDFIKQSSYIVGVKNSRWEGVGMNSNFIKVLAKSYETVAKELNKFKQQEISDNDLQTIDSIYSKLGNKTKSENVIIKSWDDLKNVTKAVVEKTPQVGDIVDIDFYFEKENINTTVKAKITELEKFYQGASVIKDNDGNIIKEEKGTPEYFITLQKLDNSKIYNFAVNESGEITQVAGANSKTFVGSNHYIKQFDLTQDDVQIISTRIKNSNEHFGNPFTHDTRLQNLIQVKSTKEAVKRYINWVITGETNEYIFTGIQPEELDNQREWILEQLKSGELKNKSILYYKELGEPSHATALDYLINKYDWENENSSNTSGKQLSLFDNVEDVTDIVNNELRKLTNDLNNIENQEDDFNCNMQ